MLNIIWPIIIMASFLYAIIFGYLPETNNAIFESCQMAINTALALIGSMALWNGIIKIAIETSLVNKIKKFLAPVLKYLFPDINKNSKAYNNICLNIIANILGLGNAATSLGIKAMEELQKQNNNKYYLSNSMKIFIVINTASIQLIPTTVIAIRNSLESKNPTSVILPVWIVTAGAIISAIVFTKIIIKKEEKNENN